MIKAVFFDCDGVLIDSERVHQRYNVQFARENGLTLEPEDFYPFIGVTTRSDIWNGIYAKAGSPWSQEEFTRRFRAFKAQRIEGLHFGTILFPDIPAVLEELKERDLIIACASSSSMKYLEKVMEQCRLGQWFDLLVTGRDFKESKPAPDIYLHCSKVFDLSPEECLVIEDSPYGIRAGRAAGMEVLARRDTTFGMDQSEATALFDDARDILTYLDRNR